MKKHILTGFALAILTLAAAPGRAANMNLLLEQDPYLFGSTASGRLWVGNFANGLNLLNNSQISALDYGTLGSYFRPAAHFSISNGAVGDSRGLGYSTQVPVGTALGAVLGVGPDGLGDTDDDILQGVSVSTGQFAGQALYFLALSDSSTTFSLDAGDFAILFSANSGFGTGTSDPAVNNINVFLDTSGGTFLLGTQSAGVGGVVSGVAIPEPASSSLFLLGAAGVLALRCLRKTNV